MQQQCRQEEHRIPKPPEQYTNIEKRKQKSREKIELSWKKNWKDQLGNMNPDWESEHYLQHLSVLAREWR